MGTPFKKSTHFAVYGSMIDRNGGTEADTKQRIGKEQAAFTSLGKIWKTEEMSIRTKLSMRLFNSKMKQVIIRVQSFIIKCLSFR